MNVRRHVLLGFMDGHWIAFVADSLFISDICSETQWPLWWCQPISCFVSVAAVGPTIEECRRSFTLLEMGGDAYSCLSLSIATGWAYNFGAASNTNWVYVHFRTFCESALFKPAGLGGVGLIRANSVEWAFITSSESRRSLDDVCSMSSESRRSTHSSHLYVDRCPLDMS